MSKIVGTKFCPNCHGWHFGNVFKSFIHSNRIKTMGFCGGMVFSALDYAYEGKPIPRITETPDSGPLYEYILQRQLDSLCHGNFPNCGTIIKILYWQNQLDSRLAIFTLLEWNKIKKLLDAGIPIPLMLISPSEAESPEHNHQVLGIGYTLQPTKNNKRVHLYVYNPNWPNTTQVLKFNSEIEGAEPPYTRATIMLSDSTGKQLRGFFINPYDREHGTLRCDFMSQIVNPMLMI